MEMKIEAQKTYATADNARKAVVKTGDEKYRHIIIQNEQGRWFPLFIVKPDSLAHTGLHFRWNVVSA